MFEIPRYGLTGNDATDEELAAHGLTFVDAQEVYDGPAKFFPQDARSGLDEEGVWFRQPRRLRMIRPNQLGQLLMIVLELPAKNGTSHVVTGYPADKGQQARYRQPGGRTRRR